ncbi:MAG: hypothetical protein K940chlam2_00430 [Chlamydiae bacterium]|nr:hypothetical protein [Chlamydiota bacterium]
MAILIMPLADRAMEDLRPTAAPMSPLVEARTIQEALAPRVVLISILVEVDLPTAEVGIKVLPLVEVDIKVPLLADLVDHLQVLLALEMLHLAEDIPKVPLLLADLLDHLRVLPALLGKLRLAEDTPQLAALHLAGPLPEGMPDLHPVDHLQAPLARDKLRLAEDITKTKVPLLLADLVDHLRVLPEGIPHLGRGHQANRNKLVRFESPGEISRAFLCLADEICELYSLQWASGH